MRKELREGDLVTLDFGEFVDASNTYKFVSKTRSGKCLLNHPLAPDCYILRDEEELDNVMATLPSPLEKCLIFCARNKEFLDYQTLSDLDALKYHFVIKRDLTNRQKQSLSKICGQIAEYKFKYNLQKAISLITENKALLDEFNLMWFEAFRKIFQDPTQIRSKGQRHSIFNMAGFVLAQLDTSESSKDSQ